jgi:hypothetical protein
VAAVREVSVLVEVIGSAFRSQAGASAPVGGGSPSLPRGGGTWEGDSGLGVDLVERGREASGAGALLARDQCAELGARGRRYGVAVGLTLVEQVPDQDGELPGQGDDGHVVARTAGRFAGRAPDVSFPSTGSAQLSAVSVRRLRRVR